MLGYLRVEMASDALRISARYRALDLLATLTLTNVVTQAGLLLTRTVLSISY